jgi:threonine dehydrogenase-like Zn-dependent dehydrogenase
VRATRSGGRLLSVGTVMPSGTVAFDPAEFTRTGISIEAVIRYRPRRLYETVGFLRRNTDVPWAALVDEEFPGREVGPALDAAATGRATRVSLRLGPA